MPAIIRDGEPVEIFLGAPFTDSIPVNRSANWLKNASPAERDEAGILDIVEPPSPPKGKVNRRLGLDVVDGAVVRTFIVEDEPPEPEPVAPDNPSLRHWRTGLKRWIMPDGTTRFAAVDAAVARLEASSRPSEAIAGMAAREGLDYANTVARSELMSLAPAFGFSAADVEESLWRADQVRQGDLSGAWPLPTARAA